MCGKLQEMIIQTGKDVRQLFKHWCSPYTKDNDSIHLEALHSILISRLRPDIVYRVNARWQNIRLLKVNPVPSPRELWWAKGSQTMLPAHHIEIRNTVNKWSFVNFYNVKVKPPCWRPSGNGFVLTTDSCSNSDCSYNVSKLPRVLDCRKILQILSNLNVNHWDRQSLQPRKERYPMTLILKQFCCKCQCWLANDCCKIPGRFWPSIKNLRSKWIINIPGERSVWTQNGLLKMKLDTRIDSVIAVDGKDVLLKSL